MSARRAPAPVVAHRKPRATTAPARGRRAATSSPAAAANAVVSPGVSALTKYLPRLVGEYDRGALVPFVGAGITYPNCVLWEEFVFNLEKATGGHAKQARFVPTNDPPAKLVQRAERAVRKIRHTPQIKLADAVKSAIASQQRYTAPPPASAALAEIPWPLIITTNYDDWLLSEINRSREGRLKDAFDGMQVCGRGRADTERIINSLRAPDQPLLWAIQGFVGGQAPNSTRFEPFPQNDLAEQLVVGHEEYRREAFRSIGFRRAFAEVFRNRSLLFIGSGLSEGYFENLFDETLELQGAVGHSHYAFVEQGKLDPDVLRGRFQIEAIEYPAGQYGTVLAWLGALKQALDHRTIRNAGWSFSLRAKQGIGYGEVPDLQVVRSRLPVPKKGECIVISAGLGSTRPALSSSGDEVLRQCLPTPKVSPKWALLRKDPHVWRAQGMAVFAVAARDSTHRGADSRDARTVKEAIPAMMEEVARRKFRRVYAMLLSAGERRVFPPHVSLLQMARGFAEWKRGANGKARESELVICVVDPRPLALLASGRLNLQEVLSVPQTRFWLEIERPGARQVTRYLVHEDPATLLADLVQRFDLGGTGWSAWVLPSPVAGQKLLRANDIIGYQGDEPWTVENAGLLAGSTLRVVI